MISGGLECSSVELIVKPSQKTEIEMWREVVLRGKSGE